MGLKKWLVYREVLYVQQIQRAGLENTFSLEGVREYRGFGLEWFHCTCKSTHIHTACTVHTHCTYDIHCFAYKECALHCMRPMESPCSNFQGKQQKELFYVYCQQFTESSFKLNMEVTKNCSWCIAVKPILKDISELHPPPLFRYKNHSPASFIQVLPHLTSLTLHVYI